MPSFINFLSVMFEKVWPSIFCLRRILKSSSSRFIFRLCKKIMRVSVFQFLTKEEQFANVEVEVDIMIRCKKVKNK